MREVSELLASWNSFYVMIGSAAATLTGLMFVVITLVSDEKRAASEAGVSLFSSPTVVHFCCPLLTAALMSAPFRSLGPIAIVLGISGCAGILFVVRIAFQTSRLTSYRPDAEDWIWHVFLPLFAYALILLGAIAMQGAAARALFAPATGVTLLIFVGIHNAWDVVTFLATGKAEALPDPPASAGESQQNG